MAAPRTAARTAVKTPAPEHAFVEPDLRAAAREPARDTAREEAANMMPMIPGRAVALNRAGKPIQRAAAETGVDEFAIPPHLPPPGWSWEWKEDTILGEVRSGMAAKQAQNGWESVMYESYPGIFAPQYDDQGRETKGPVRRGGLKLMERSIILTGEAMADEKRKADERVGQAKHQYTKLDTSGTSTVEIDDAARRMSGIRQTREVVEYPTPPPGQRQRIE